MPPQSIFAAIRGASLLGIALTAGSAGISHLSQTAQLPPFLSNGGVQHWASLIAIAGIPLEFLWAVWFGVAAALSNPATVGVYRSVPRLLLWSGAVALGLGAGLAYSALRAGVWCVPLLVGALLTAVDCLLLAFADRWVRVGTAAIPKAIAVDLTAAASKPSLVFRWVTAAALVALTGQYLVLSARATTPDDRRAQVTRWFMSLPRASSMGLTEQGIVRVVVFSDYECPYCSIQVPALRAVVDRYRHGGYPGVEFVLKEFPLDPACNPAATIRVHPSACDAAAAVSANSNCVRRWSTRQQPDARRLGDNLGPPRASAFVTVSPELSSTVSLMRGGVEWFD